MTGQAQARRALAAGSKSFALAGKLLPRACRDDAAVVYAWCRRADDRVDGAAPGEAAAAVGELRRELAALYGGAAQDDAVLAAFQEVIGRRRIPIEYPTALLDGFAMDARPRPVVFTAAELPLYCYRVAGVVGLMMCHVMGVRDERCLPDAAALGMAMQLTNIARDVAEDWRLGRVYVPDVGHGPPGELTPAARAAFAAALPPLLARARVLYAQGARGLDALSFRCAVAVRTAGLVYAAIGAIVAARGYDVTAPRAVVSTPRKLWLLARAFAGVAARRLARGLTPARATHVPEGRITEHELAAG